LDPIDSGARSTFDALDQHRFARLAALNAQGAPVADVAKNQFVGFLQGSGAGIFSRGRLTPQHSGGNHDIEGAEPADEAAYRWIQYEVAKAGIMAQKVISVPQAEPRQE